MLFLQLLMLLLLLLQLLLLFLQMLLLKLLRNPFELEKGNAFFFSQKKIGIHTIVKLFWQYIDSLLTL